MNTDTLPKIELHVHLDCNLSYALVSRINPSITPAAYRAAFIAPPKIGRAHV